MSIHEQNANVVSTLIQSISAMDDAQTQPNLGDRNLNRVLANFNAAPDIEALLSLFTRHSVGIRQFSSAIENYTRESVRSQTQMLTRILDIPPYIDDAVDDFI